MDDHPIDQDPQIQALRALFTSLEVAHDSIHDMCAHQAKGLSPTLGDNDPHDVILSVISIEVRHRIHGILSLIDSTEGAFEALHALKEAEHANPLKQLLLAQQLNDRLANLDITFEDIDLRLGIKPQTT